MESTDYMQRLTSIMAQKQATWTPRIARIIFKNFSLSKSNQDVILGDLSGVGLLQSMEGESPLAEQDLHPDKIDVQGPFLLKSNLYYYTRACYI